LPSGMCHNLSFARMFMQGMNMRFAELVSSIKEFNKRGSATLIIIPIYTEYGHLAEHLDALSRQTFQDFDAILVLNKVSEESKVYEAIEKKKPDFGIIVAIRKDDTGSAGGFFTGQRYALENGYRQMIFADIDCMPVSADLVEALVSNRDRGFVKPTARVMEEGRLIQLIPGWVIPWYGLLTTELARRYGLYYLPLYYGAEDSEYGTRIKITPHIIASQCQHPWVALLSYDNLDKSMKYQVNSLAISRKTGAESWFIIWATLALSLPVHLIFFPPYGRRAVSTMMSCLLSHTYGKAASDRLSSGFRDYIVDKIPENFAHVNYSSPLSFDLGYLLMPFGVFRDTFRKNTAIDSSRSGIAVAFASVFSKKAYFRTKNGGYLPLADNSNPLIHAIKLLIFAALLPVFAVFIVAIILPLNMLLHPQTERYGLD
jgi:hypothetical protein